MCPKYDILKKLMVPMFSVILNLQRFWENVSFYSSIEYFFAFVMNGENGKCRVHVFTGFLNVKRGIRMR